MILDRFKVTDKVAIVTGAGRGIGRGIALALAEAGAVPKTSWKTQRPRSVAAVGARSSCRPT